MRNKKRRFYNDALLLSVDDYDMRVAIQIKDTIIKGMAFEVACSRKVGRYYKVILEPDSDTIYEKIEGRLENKLERPGKGLSYIIQGYVENDILHVDKIKFNIKRYNEYNMYHKKYLRIEACYICIDIIEELPEKNDYIENQ